MNGARSRNINSPCRAAIKATASAALQIPVEDVVDVTSTAASASYVFEGAIAEASSSSGEMFKLAIVIRMNIPLKGTFAAYASSPGSLYSTLTTRLSLSVSSGNLTRYLQVNAIDYSAAALTTATVSAVTMGSYSVHTQQVSSSGGSGADSSEGTSVLVIALAVTGSVIVAGLIFLLYYYNMRCCKTRLIYCTLLIAYHNHFYAALEWPHLLMSYLILAIARDNKEICHAILSPLLTTFLQCVIVVFALPFLIASNGMFCSRIVRFEYCLP